MIYFISDTHFNHANILKFETGRKPGYEEVIFKNIAKVVGKNDTLVHLGDFTFGHKPDRERVAERWSQIRCAEMILVLGNHDRHGLDYYSEACGFDTIHTLYFVMEDILFSHYPMAHPTIEIEDPRYSAEKAKLRTLFDMNDLVLNVHGHTHSYVVPDFRYLNVSVENTDYYPLSLSAIKQHMKVGSPYGL